MKTPLESRSIDASPLVEMNIAIGGEGDAPAKRCGATLKINGDIASVLDNEYDLEDALSTYLLGLEATDTDFESQAVSGTPIEIEENYYIPIAIGITKSLGDHITSLWDDDGYRCDAKIVVDEADDISALYQPMVCSDESGNNVLAFLVSVDDTETTTLCEDNWTSLELTFSKAGAENIVETYDFFNDKSFAPTDLAFTPAEQSEGD